MNMIDVVDTMMPPEAKQIVYSKLVTPSGAVMKEHLESLKDDFSSNYDMSEEGCLRNEGRTLLGCSGT